MTDAQTRNNTIRIMALVAIATTVSVVLLASLLSRPMITSTTELTPLSLGKRTFHVHVPSGTGPFPVILGLHARGGTGWGILQVIKAQQFSKGFILVCPDGPSNSWNVVADPSSEPDADFVGRVLLNHVANYANVSPSFHLFGQSNGAALTNRILIENDDGRLLTGITDSAQLNEYQWHNGSFFQGGASNDYSVQKVPRQRRIFQITGGADGIVPSDGTTRSAIESKQPGTNMLFLSWQKSASAYAQAYGAPSPSPEPSPLPYEVVTSGNNVVVAFHDPNGGHILVGDPTDAVTMQLDAMIASFLKG